MSKISVMYRLAPVAIWCAALGLVAILGGCGSSETTDTSELPPPPTVDSSTAPTGSAFDDPVPMSDLELESAIRRVKDKNGLEFLHFDYADRDGKVYKVVLPAKLAEEKHKIPEWESLFSVYRKPEVVAQKKVSGKKKEGLNDFPFISPRPKQPEKTETAPEVRPAPMPLPPLPAGPTAPSSPSSDLPPSPRPLPAPVSGS